MRFAEDVLLHEMLHVALFAMGVDNDKEHPHHNTEQWCAEIMRITPALGLPPVKAAREKTRRIDGKVARRALDGHVPRGDISRAGRTRSDPPADLRARHGAHQGADLNVAASNVLHGKDTS